jgi:hypothetical protein
MGQHNLSDRFERQKMLARSMVPLAPTSNGYKIVTYSCSGQGNCTLGMTILKKLGVFNWLLNEPCQYVDHTLRFEKILGCLTTT